MEQLFLWYHIILFWGGVTSFLKQIVNVTFPFFPVLFGLSPSIYCAVGMLPMQYGSGSGRHLMVWGRRTDLDFTSFSITSCMLRLMLNMMHRLLLRLLSLVGNLQAASICLFSCWPMIKVLTDGHQAMIYSQHQCPLGWVMRGKLRCSFSSHLQSTTSAH